MKELPPPARGTLVAALAFDDQIDQVITSANDLARRFALEIRFVHVVEEFAPEVWSTGISGLAAVPAYPLMIQRRKNDARDRLEEIVRDTFRDFVATHPALGTGAATAEHLLERDYADRKTNLSNRGQPYRAHATAIESDIRSGNVLKELHTSIVEFNPDLIVFGRHHALKTRPYLMGRVPFRTMLLEKKAVLVVPPADALYANLGFPS